MFNFCVVLLAYCTRPRTHICAGICRLSGVTAGDEGWYLEPTGKMALYTVRGLGPLCANHCLKELPRAWHRLAIDLSTAGKGACCAEFNSSRFWHPVTILLSSLFLYRAQGHPRRNWGAALLYGHRFSSHTEVENASSINPFS